jgi:hypothetical protein
MHIPESVIVIFFLGISAAVGAVLGNIIAFKFDMWLEKRKRR